MNTGALPSRWNLKSWREPGAGTHQEPQLFIMSELLFSAFVRGPKTPGGNAVSEGTAAAWFLPHLPTVQKNKKKQKAICLSRLSCDTFLSVSSTTLLEKKKKKKSPAFWLLHCSCSCYCHTEIQPKAPSGKRLHTSTSMLATDTGGLVKNALASCKNGVSFSAAALTVMRGERRQTGVWGGDKYFNTQCI